mgnify:CR=1 FL=1
MIDIITGPTNHGHMIAGSTNTMHMIDNSIVYGYDVAVILRLQDVHQKKPSIPEYGFGQLSVTFFVDDRLNAKERGLASMTTYDILEGFTDRGHSTLKSEIIF